jgi:hypothetical protein
MKRLLFTATLAACVAAGSFLASPVRCLAEDTAAASKDKPSTPPADSKPADKDKEKSDPAGVSKFYGNISAVDTKANTFVIDNVTYNIVPESHMTKADDSAATLADAVVGQPARGSFTKSADGKLNVTKVRFGKKTGGKSGGKSGGKKKEGAESSDAKDSKDEKAKDAPATSTEK